MSFSDGAGTNNPTEAQRRARDQRQRDRGQRAINRALGNFLAREQENEQAFLDALNARDNNGNVVSARNAGAAMAPVSAAIEQRRAAVRANQREEAEEIDEDRRSARTNRGTATLIQDQVARMNQRVRHQFTLNRFQSQN